MKKALSLLAMALLVSCGLVLTVPDGADASTYTRGSAGSPLSSFILSYDDLGTMMGADYDIYVAVGSYVSIPVDWSDGEVAYWYDPGTLGSGLSKNGSAISGTLSGTGVVTMSFAVEIIGIDVEGYDTWRIHPVQTAPNTVTFNANGGSCSVQSSDVAKGSSLTLPSASKQYCTFSGWYTAQSGGTRVGGAGESYTPSGNITLYAQYNAVPVFFTTVQGNEYCIQGSSFSYTAGTSPSDATISVSGVSWLSVSGKTVSGTPGVSVAPGTYHATLTAVYGNQSAVQTFDLTVVEKLAFESVPTGGIIANPV